MRHFEDDLRISRAAGVFEEADDVQEAGVEEGRSGMADGAHRPPSRHLA